MIPFVDRVRPLVDLREQVVTFPPQPVITEDNVSVGIDTVLYFTITDPKAATYEVANPLQAIEQLTVTTLRNIIGSLTLEETLTSRDQVNERLRIVLDERTGKWGIRINGVELKSVDPPGTIQEAMEKQMRAERDRRAAILTAEGVKQSQILRPRARSSRRSSRRRAPRRPRCCGPRASRRRSRRSSTPSTRVGPDPELLSYQYLQMLPRIAEGSANKIWVIPSELTQALGTLGQRLIPPGEAPAPAPPDRPAPPARGDGPGRPDGPTGPRAV